MQLRQRHQFTTIRTEGSILPADLLQRINERGAGLAGLKPDDYHLPGNLKLNEAINQSWNRLLGAWTAFHSTLTKLPNTDPATTLTREKWLLPVFNELGYGRLLTARAIELDGRSYPVSHGWQHTPLHLVGAGVDLDNRTAGVAGAARMSPHGLVQELLNRSEAHLWGMVSNGLRLRILRDNVSLTRQAYVEFDLEAMMNGELYADFALFWLLCHESRVHAEKPQDCWLEKWSRAAQDQGTRALEQLRRGVEEAIEALGRGFLAHASNHALVARLRTGALSTQDYYRQLLRLVYRLLFLFVAEDRDLLLLPDANTQARARYERFYSLSRLRLLAEKRVGTRHADLYHGLRIVMAKLGSDTGCPELGLPALGSFLFSREALPDLEACDIANAYLLDAVRALAFINDRHGRRLVDYKNLRSEELGSVYEALLELLPDVHIEALQFALKTVSGSERKSTGSYYTPESLVQCLLDSALEPVVAEVLKQPDTVQAILRLKGGFDVVLGNPPWDRIKLQEKEWFAVRRPEIANAPNAAARRRMIEALRDEDAALYEAFLDDRRKAEGESHFVRSSERYPLCGRGDVNTYAIFAETNRMLINAKGHVGCIVPSGIATDDTTKEFFQDLVEKKSLVSLYDFQSGPGLFSEIGHARFKFCLLTLSGLAELPHAGAEFAFFLRNVNLLQEPARRFRLTAQEIALLNPNTRTCPIFRSKRDAELTKAIYTCVPVFITENKPDGNPWGTQFMRMLDMANDSGLFRTREQLEEAGLQLYGNVFCQDGSRCLPLYEAKMLHHFTHRFGDYTDYPEDALTTQLPDVPLERLQNPNYVVQPRYWVPESKIEERLNNKWDRQWLLGWRDICRSTDERTVIASVLPRIGVGHTSPLMFLKADTSLVECLQGNLTSLVFDFCARQKIGGTHLTYGYLNQLPVLPPSPYAQACQWLLSQTLRAWLAPRVLELTYTAYDLQAFATDCGYSGPPFRWDEARRFLLRCELDAAYFHLYSIGRDDVDYILETFPIVKRKDEQAHGEYRTKRVILDMYDAMQQAMETGTPYHTRLDPPPANGWTPPEITLEAVAGPQGDGAKEDTGASSPVDFQRCAEPIVSQPRLNFDMMA